MNGINPTLEPHCGGLDFLFIGGFVSKRITPSNCLNMFIRLPTGRRESDIGSKPLEPKAPRF